METIDLDLVGPQDRTQNRPISPTDSVIIVRDVTASFPTWLDDFNKDCYAIIGINSLKKLDKLMELYLMNIRKEVDFCYKSPNRAHYVARYMYRAIIFFHMNFQDLRDFFMTTHWIENIVEMLSIYCQLEIKSALRTQRGKENDGMISSRIMNLMWICLDHSEEHMIHVLLKTAIYTKRQKDIFDPIFRKLLTTNSKSIRQLSDLEYIRNLFAFKMWKRMMYRNEKKEISDLALKILQQPETFTFNYHSYSFLPPCTDSDIHYFLVTTYFDLSKCIEDYFIYTNNKQNKNLVTDNPRLDKVSFLTNFFATLSYEEDDIENMTSDMTETCCYPVLDSIKLEGPDQEDDDVIIIDDVPPEPQYFRRNVPEVICEEVIDLTEDEPEVDTLPIWIESVIRLSQEEETQEDVESVAPADSEITVVEPLKSAITEIEKVPPDENINISQPSGDTEITEAESTVESTQVPPLSDEEVSNSEGSRVDSPVHKISSTNKEEICSMEVSASDVLWTQEDAEVSNNEEDINISDVERNEVCSTGNQQHFTTNIEICRENIDETPNEDEEKNTNINENQINMLTSVMDSSHIADEGTIPVNSTKENLNETIITNEDMDLSLSYNEETTSPSNSDKTTEQIVSQNEPVVWSSDGTDTANSEANTMELELSADSKKKEYSEINSNNISTPEPEEEDSEEAYTNEIFKEDIPKPKAVEVQIVPKDVTEDHGELGSDVNDINEEDIMAYVDSDDFSTDVTEEEIKKLGIDEDDNSSITEDEEFKIHKKDVCISKIYKNKESTIRKDHKNDILPSENHKKETNKIKIEHVFEDQKCNKKSQRHKISVNEICSTSSTKSNKRTAKFELKNKPVEITELEEFHEVEHYTRAHRKDNTSKKKDKEYYFSGIKTRNNSLKHKEIHIEGSNKKRNNVFDQSKENLIVKINKADVNFDSEILEKDKLIHSGTDEHNENDISSLIPKENSYKKELVTLKNHKKENHKKEIHHRETKKKEASSTVSHRRTRKTDLELNDFLCQKSDEEKVDSSDNKKESISQDVGNNRRIRKSEADQSDISDQKFEQQNGDFDKKEIISQEFITTRRTRKIGNDPNETFGTKPFEQDTVVESKKENNYHEIIKEKPFKVSKKLSNLQETIQFEPNKDIILDQIETTEEVTTRVTRSSKNNKKILKTHSNKKNGKTNHVLTTDIDKQDTDNWDEIIEYYNAKNSKTQKESKDNEKSDNDLIEEDDTNINTSKLVIDEISPTKTNRKDEKKSKRKTMKIENSAEENVTVRNKKKARKEKSVDLPIEEILQPAEVSNEICNVELIKEDIYTTEASKDLYNADLSQDYCDIRINTDVSYDATFDDKDDEICDEELNQINRENVCATPLDIIDDNSIHEENSDGLTEISSTSYSHQHLETTNRVSFSPELVKSLEDSSSSPEIDTFEHVDSTSDITNAHSDQDPENLYVTECVIEQSIGDYHLKDTISCGEVTTEFLTDVNDYVKSVTDPAVSAVPNSVFEHFVNKQTITTGSVDNILCGKEPTKTVQECSVRICDNIDLGEYVHERVLQYRSCSEGSDTNPHFDTHSDCSIDESSPDVEPMNSSDFSSYLTEHQMNFSKDSMNTGIGDLTVNRKRKNGNNNVRTYTAYKPAMKVPKIDSIAQPSELSSVYSPRSELRVPVNGERIVRFNNLWDSYLEKHFRLTPEEIEMCKPELYVTRFNKPPTDHDDDDDSYDKPVESHSYSQLRPYRRFDMPLCPLQPYKAKTILERQDYVKDKSVPSAVKALVDTRPTSDVMSGPISSASAVSTTNLLKGPKKRGGKQSTRKEVTKRQRNGKQKTTRRTKNASNTSTVSSPSVRPSQTRPWRYTPT